MSATLTSISVDFSDSDDPQVTFFPPQQPFEIQLSNELAATAALRETIRKDLEYIENATSDASVSKAAAKALEDAAALSASAASASETAAKASEDAAALSASVARTSEAAAKASEDAVASSASVASASEAAAKTAEDSAASAANDAIASRAAAKVSEVAATNSASVASASGAAVQADRVAVTSLRNEVEAGRAEVASHKTLVLEYRDETLAARDETKTTAASLTGVISEAGGFDASSNTLPAKPSFSTFWKITSAGTLDGVGYGVGDSLVYSLNTDSFYKIDNTESVTSVNGKQGVVSLSATDVGALPASTSVADLGGYAKSTIDSALAGKSDTHSHPYHSNTWVPTWAQVTGKPTSFTPASHNHDDRYYTGAEVDSLVSGLVARVVALEAKLVNVTVFGTKTVFSGEIEAVDLGIGG